MGARSSETLTEAEIDEPVLTRKTLVYRVVRLLVWSFNRTYLRLSVEGREHLPATGGVLLACNHQSMIDIPLISSSTQRHVAFVARDSLADHAWLAFVMRECGAVLVKRGHGDRRALRAMAAHLAAGDCVAIYPEGTRTHDGRVGEFRGGALLAARMAEVPIVPIGIRGAFEAWPRQRAFPLPRKVAVRFGAPIDPNLPDALARLQSSVEALVGDGTYASVPRLR